MGRVPTRRSFSCVVLGAGRVRRRKEKDKMVASAMTRRGALAALGAFGLTLTGAAFGARAQSGLRFRDIVVNVEPLRALTGDPTAAWMEQALRQALASGLGPPSRAWRQKRASSRGPDRLDLSRPEPRRPRGERLGAGHDHREVSCSGADGRNRAGSPAAGDRVLLSERRRPGARRTRLSRAHNDVGAGLRRLGAEGIGTLVRGGDCLRRLRAIARRHGWRGHGQDKTASRRRPGGHSGSPATGGEHRHVRARDGQFRPRRSAPGQSRNRAGRAPTNIGKSPMPRRRARPISSIPRGSSPASRRRSATSMRSMQRRRASAGR